mgnify:CR=1 FL=1
MNQRNRVSFFNILSTCLLYGISIFTAPLFSRLLGTGGYGNVSNYNVWVSVLAIAATMQTQGTLVNARVEYPEETQIRYQSSVMSLSFLVFAGVTALAVTKLDGTAKGGIVIAVADQLNLPVKFIGVGEQADDLMPFVAWDFVSALI